MSILCAWARIGRTPPAVTTRTPSCIPGIDLRQFQAITLIRAANSGAPPSLTSGTHAHSRLHLSPFLSSNCGINASLRGTHREFSSTTNAAPANEGTLQERTMPVPIQTGTLSTSASTSISNVADSPTPLAAMFSTSSLPPVKEFASKLIGRPSIEQGRSFSDAARTPRILGPPIDPATVLPPPIPPYQSRGESVPPPPGAPADVRYCRMPTEPWRHYIVGEDGSLYSEHSHRWAGGAVNPRVVVGDFVRIRLIPTSTALGKPKQMARDEIVLIAHGYPQPSDSSTAVVYHRDGNTLNDALENLQWRDANDWSIYPELVSAAVEAASRGEKLEFRRTPRFPTVFVLSDGRIWNRFNLLGWTKGASRTPTSIPTLEIQTADGNGTTCRISRGELVWDAFHGRPLTPGLVIDYIDGNVENCRIENLREVNPRPMSLEVTGQFFVHRPPPTPRTTVLKSQAPPEQRYAHLPGALPDVDYARFPEDDFSHYVVGTDGSVRNLHYLDRPMWSKPTKDKGFTLKMKMLGRSGVRRTELLANVVLKAHGYPRPSEMAHARHIDGDLGNSKLENLFWETPEDVFRHQIALAAAQGKTIEFRAVPGFSRYFMCTDGRCWSTHLHCFMRVTDGRYPLYQDKYHQTKLKVAAWLHLTFPEQFPAEPEPENPRASRSGKTRRRKQRAETEEEDEQIAQAAANVGS